MVARAMLSANKSGERAEEIARTRHAHMRTRAKNEMPCSQKSSSVRNFLGRQRRFQKPLNKPTQNRAKYSKDYWSFLLSAFVESTKAVISDAADAEGVASASGRWTEALADLYTRATRAVTRNSPKAIRKLKNVGHSARKLYTLKPTSSAALEAENGCN